MKKQWISVKCGLSRDPKHRQAMGESIWLFLHMLDRADWERGKVMEWKDEAEADEMGMPVRTLREHRRKLEELDYITCTQKQYGQEITIHNWTNPREYSGAVLNKKQGDMETEPQEVQGDTQDYMQGDTQGNRKDVTPTSNSKNQISNKAGLSKKEIKQANEKVTAILENEKKVKYQNRDKLPEPYHHFSDLYHELTKQEPTKRVLMDWMQTFEEWKQEGLTPEHIKAAYKFATRPEGGFLVARPGSLTNTAVAMKTKMLSTQSGLEINESEIQRTKQLIDNSFSGEFVPRPAHVAPPSFIKQKMSDLAQGMNK